MSNTVAAAQPQGQQPTRDQVRDQIRDQIREAVRGAEDAAREAGNEVQVVSVTKTPNGDRKVLQLPNGQRLTLDGDAISLTGETVRPRVDFRNAVPDGAVDIAQAFVAMVVLCVVGLPLARAYARWLDRRGSAAKVPAEVLTRLASIENAVETVAVEVERISEGQRFTAKLLSERAQAEHISR